MCVLFSQLSWRPWDETEILTPQPSSAGSTARGWNSLFRGGCKTQNVLCEEWRERGGFIYSVFLMHFNEFLWSESHSQTFAASSSEFYT